MTAAHPGGEVDDVHRLQRFVDAQEPVIDDVRRELAQGRKTSHWIWFIFPQVAGLGLSAMSREFAIQSLDEARAYLAHPILGPRLCECANLVRRWRDGRSGTSSAMTGTSSVRA
jgi:uncharacterized protein (DUF1810 family)